MQAPIACYYAFQSIKKWFESVIKVKCRLQIESVLTHRCYTTAHLYDYFRAMLDGRLTHLFVLVKVEESTVLVNYHLVSLIKVLEIKLMGRLLPE